MNSHKHDLIYVRLTGQALYETENHCKNTKILMIGIDYLKVIFAKNIHTTSCLRQEVCSVLLVVEVML
jgi:hypothetical protein